MTERCREIAERLTAFLDGALSPEENRDLQEHIDGCRECRQILLEHRAAWDLLDAWPGIEPSPAFATETVGRVLDRATEKNRWVRRALLTAAAVLIVGTGIVLYRFSPARDTAVGEPGAVFVEQEVDPRMLNELDLLEDMEFLDEFGEDLELVMEYDLNNLLLSEGNF